MEIKEIKVDEKNDHYFICSDCNFKCSYVCDWNRHISTRKHFINKSGDLTKNDTKLICYNKKLIFECECGKSYLTNSGLWKHKKICTFINSNYSNKPIEEIDIKITHQMFYDLLKQNIELQKSIISIGQDKGLTKEETEKIIKNVVQETVIDKSQKFTNF